MFNNSIYILGPYTKKCLRNVCFYYCHCLLLPKLVLTTAASSLGSRQGQLWGAVLMSSPACLSPLLSSNTPCRAWPGQSCDPSKGSGALGVGAGREGRGHWKFECCLSFFALIMLPKVVFVHVDSGFELLNLQWPRSQF